MMGCEILRFREDLVTMRPQTVGTTDNIIMDDCYDIATYVWNSIFVPYLVDFFPNILIDLTELENVGSQSTKYFLSIPRIKHYSDKSWLLIFLAIRSTIVRRPIRDQLLIFIEYTKKRIPMRSSCIQMKTKNTVVFHDT